MFLEKIKRLKQKELNQLVISDEDKKRAKQMTSTRSLSTSMSGSPLSLIAEVKPASPSQGVIQTDVDPVETALAYERGGAHAISVLTEETYFHGHPDSLTKVKQAVSLPILRKDFILDAKQVWQSKLLGADAILLIVAFLDKESIGNLCNMAHELGMEVLLEVHEEKEIEIALSTKADVFGINNRNLFTLETHLEVTERLRPLFPSGYLVIGESGIHSITDARRMAQAPVDGILVGEYLMRQQDPEKTVTQLLHGVKA